MKADSVKDFLLDQLRDLRGLECRAMFGGFGLYADDKFFGILHRGRLYFKTDDANRGAYVGRGMKCFQPNARQSLSSYYEVPADVIEHAEELVAWARAAIESAKPPA